MVCNGDIVAEVDIPRDGDVEVAWEGASLADGGTEEAEGGGSEGWEGDPEGFAEGAPEEADEALLFGPDGFAFGCGGFCALSGGVGDRRLGGKFVHWCPIGYARGGT